MKFEHTEVWGFEHAIRGMRNPKNSWDKSDSDFTAHTEWLTGVKCGKCSIGKNDMKLMQTLIRAGSEHRKFIRQIFVSVDISAPMYWWSEFDTYKVGTVANSTSKMHKLASTPITIDCFEMDDFEDFDFSEEYTMLDIWKGIIGDMEDLRQMYLTTKDKRYWKELIRLLPESWLQTRTVTMNYENLLGMCSAGQRRFHKLNEWSGKYKPEVENFIAWARTLPYAQELIFIDELKK